MQIYINGEAREVSGSLDLLALVEQLGLKSDRLAIERNRDIVPRARWNETQLEDGDKLEIVHFVGGEESSHSVTGVRHYPMLTSSPLRFETERSWVEFHLFIKGQRRLFPLLNSYHLRKSKLLSESLLVDLRLTSGNCLRH